MDETGTQTAARHRSLGREAVFTLGKVVISGLEWFIGRGSETPDVAYPEPADFPWTAGLEAAWPAMRAEGQALLAYKNELPNIQDVSPDQMEITQDDHWKVLVLHAYGYRSGLSAERCPETARVLDGIPGLTLAMFSILSPGKVIPPHRGAYKGVVRCHVPLIVPEPREAVALKVDGETRHWEEGHALLFDDSRVHEAWNRTEADRVVLIIDVVRPLRAPQRWLNRLVIWAIARSPFIQDSWDNLREWETRQGSAAPG